MTADDDTLAVGVGRECPSCESDSYTLHDEYAAYRCLDCDATWQESMKTDKEGEIVGILDTNLLREGDGDGA